MGGIVAAERDEAASGESRACGVWRKGRTWGRKGGLAAG